MVIRNIAFFQEYRRKSAWLLLSYQVQLLFSLCYATTDIAQDRKPWSNHHRILNLLKSRWVENTEKRRYPLRI